MTRACACLQVGCSLAACFSAFDISNQHDQPHHTHQSEILDYSIYLSLIGNIIPISYFISPASPTSHNLLRKTTVTPP
jgi:hypothetical protein